MMTKLTKKIGCSKLKDLIETNVLIITKEFLQQCLIRIPKNKTQADGEKLS